jgi:hypothetical protein
MAKPGRVALVIGRFRRERAQDRSADASGRRAREDSSSRRTFSPAALATPQQHQHVRTRPKHVPQHAVSPSLENAPPRCDSVQRPCRGRPLPPRTAAPRSPWSQPPSEHHSSGAVVAAASRLGQVPHTVACTSGRPLRRGARTVVTSPGSDAPKSTTPRCPCNEVDADSMEETHRRRWTLPTALSEQTM